jgi:hypothetical protein
MDLGAILYKANMAFVESAGHRLFGLWAKVIIRTERHSAHRRLLLKAFKYYLYVALFAVSPLGLLVFHITYPFRIKGIRRDRARRCLHLN